DYVEKQSIQLGEMLARKTARYMIAAWEVRSGRIKDAASASRDHKLDQEILERWIHYLKEPERDHPYLKAWDESMARGGAGVTLEQVKRLAGQFQDLAVSVFEEKNTIDDRNYVLLGGAKGVKDMAKRQFTNIESLEPDKFYLWRDLASEPYTKSGQAFRGGTYYYGNAPPTRGAEDAPEEPAKKKDIARFLRGEWRDRLEAMRAELDALKEALPPEYPYLHALRDTDKPANLKVAIRGDYQNQGAEAPRRFLRVLCEGEPPVFTRGSGRLALAEAIASPKNTLTARVMVNRVWLWHFGHGIVPSPSNFGQLGERPSHPELLDYLAARFVESGWSVKALHREIMLSAAYASSSEESAENRAKDPDNRLLWRANLSLRLDAETLRDALLAVSGRLDRTMGGPPAPLDDDFRRRAVYGYVGRTNPNPTMTLFDFPNPTMTAERRAVTVGPLQRLYFLNSTFVSQAANALADRLSGERGATDPDKIKRAYRLIFGRPPTEQEAELGLRFLAGGSWAQYAQVLLSSAEFSSVN
ncbi:MAG: hypothetical protein DMG07_18115, partial [Acidobacteria bacterium]